MGRPGTRGPTGRNDNKPLRSAPGLGRARAIRDAARQGLTVAVDPRPYVTGWPLRARRRAMALPPEGGAAGVPGLEARRPGRCTPACAASSWTSSTPREAAAETNRRPLLSARG